MGDIELGIPRASSLVYHCTAPETGRATGLVFVIPGFGEDAAGGYQQSLRNYLTETYGLLSVTVEYHCSQSRLSNGAVFNLSQDEYEGLRNLCAQHHIVINSPEGVKQALEQLKVNYEFEFTIAPGNGDYQNFGVMQALDHLTVLHDIQSEGVVDFDRANIIAFGSSHGGYIAHLLAKFAPNTLHAVIDNSSYTSANFIHLTAPFYFGELKITCRLLTHWEFDDPQSPFYFSVGHRAVRETASGPQISTMRQATQAPCQYRMIHSVLDDLEPIQKKREQAERLRSAGFDATLKEVAESDVDGRMVKSLGHGMDASLRALFDYFYPTLLPPPENKRSDSELGTSVAYLCDNLIYAFEHGAFGCRLNVTSFQKPQGHFRY